MTKFFGVVARAWAALPPGIRNIYHQMPLPARKIANRLFFSDQPLLVTVQTGIMKGASLEVSPEATPKSLLALIGHGGLVFRA